MTAQKKSVTVNLMNKDPFSESLLGKVLMWALSIGRYIVVFTELIVILSFLSRFKLDRDLTDLNAAIEQQLIVVESYGNLESDFRAVQAKLQVIKDRSQIYDPKELMTVIGKIMPVDVKLDQLVVKVDRVQLSGTALSTRGFSSFVRGLLNQANIKNVELTKVASNEEGPGIVFELRADVVASNNIY